ncbi:YaiI/YqxD family protein [Paenibacillus protaetiae]|uniref:UPF0178 protein ET464_07635 n=1 Tax=Paenibacillus protaetiae TaxID=2509456 RepID=A0A4P6FCX4_9BACL|nr:YaiI/YqxD family protein [Paenibacillus protaetiae]QAY68408.1 YaiI/YqxD family protein [Paenibacillus protaetiae]
MEHTIVVDGDACPVKQEIVLAGRAYSTPVLMVSSYDHRLEALDGVQVVQIDPGRDAVDLYIVNHVSKGDIVVTQDFGLACMAIGKGAYVISPRGECYTNDNIDYLMERRHELAKRRRAGGRTKGPKALSSEDKDRFQQKLTKLLRLQQEKHE